LAPVLVRRVHPIMEGLQSHQLKLIATAPPVSPCVFNLSRSFSSGSRWSVSHDVSRLDFSGLGTGAYPEFVGRAGAGLLT
jgi:hypothetical protein